MDSSSIACSSIVITRAERELENKPIALADNTCKQRGHAPMALHAPPLSANCTMPYQNVRNTLRNSGIKTIPCTESCYQRQEYEITTCLAAAAPEQLEPRPRLEPTLPWLQSQPRAPRGASAALSRPRRTTCLCIGVTESRHSVSVEHVLTQRVERTPPVPRRIVQQRAPIALQRKPPRCAQQ